MARYRFGFNAHREANSPSPLPPRALFLLQPLAAISSTSCSSLSISLAFSDFLFVPFVTTSCSPLLFSPSLSTYSSICPCQSLLFSPRGSSIGESRGVRRNKIEGMESGVRQGRYSVREKRGQLADGHGAEEIWIEYTLGVVKRGRGWLLSCFSVARTDSNRRLRITGNTTPPSSPIFSSPRRSEWIHQVSEALSDPLKVHAPRRYLRVPVRN